jgi:hypothetical protein
MKYQLADNRLTMKHFNYFIIIFLLKRQFERIVFFVSLKKIFEKENRANF